MLKLINDPLSLSWTMEGCVAEDAIRLVVATAVLLFLRFSLLFVMDMLMPLLGHTHTLSDRKLIA